MDFFFWHLCLLFQKHIWHNHKNSALVLILVHTVYSGIRLSSSFNSPELLWLTVFKQKVLERPWHHEDASTISHEDVRRICLHQKWKSLQGNKREQNWISHKALLLYLLFPFIFRGDHITLRLDWSLSFVVCLKSLEFWYRITAQMLGCAGG